MSCFVFLRFEDERDKERAFGEMDEKQNNWIRDRATNFVSCAPNVPLTDGERAALDRLVGEAHVVAIGEATHGSKELIQSRERVLRFLIQERKATIVVLEACFAATEQLNRYVVHGDGTAQDALVATAYWSYANLETLGFVDWVRNYNRALPGANRPVRIHGCDVQSIDGPKTELTRLLQGFGRTGRLSPEDVTEAAALLTALPADRDLFRFVELLVSEASSNNPDEARIADIQAQQSAFMATVRVSVEKFSRRIQEVQQALFGTALDDDRFVFERCRRLLEQVIEFYSPGGLEKRDLFMAENVTALRRQFPRARLLLSSHNLHTGRVPLTIRSQPFVPMGCLLARQMGNDYRALGTAFHQGKYLAVAGDRPRRTKSSSPIRPVLWHANTSCNGLLTTGRLPGCFWISASGWLKGATFRGRPGWKCEVAKRARKEITMRLSCVRGRNFNSTG